MRAKEHLTDDEKQWAAAGLGVQASAMHKTQPREGDMTGRTRFRVEPTGWGPWAKPLVVLQAEYLTTRGGPDNYDPRWHEDLVPVWRDVRPEHMPEFEARGRVNKPDDTRAFYRSQLAKADDRIVDLLKELDAANAKIAELERYRQAWRDATHPSAPAEAVSFGPGGVTFGHGRSGPDWFATDTRRVTLSNNTVPVNPPEGAPAGRYMVGQRVILNGVEIGTVCVPETKALPNTDTEVWVHSPSRGHASRYAVHNIRPLPGGQL